MAQRRYSKLRFESPEKTLDTDETDTTDSNHEEPATTSTQPLENVPTTPTHSSPLRDMTSSTIEREGKPDPSIVMTRDYYGLAETVGGNHSCLILITNRSQAKELRDPVIYAKRGYNRIPPDSKIPPETNAYCAFRKPSIAMKGTCGVLSYEYERREGRSKRFAVMWRVPYRMIQQGGENEVALKWMDVDMEDSMEAQRHTALELYREMSAAERADRGSVAVVVRQVAKNGKSLHIVNPENGAELDATFSSNSKAIVKVDFSYPSLI